MECHLKGIKVTSSEPDLSPRIDPTKVANLKLTIIKKKVKNVHVQEVGENRCVRFQNFDVSSGYLVQK